jgi:hypothetical protein
MEYKYLGIIFKTSGIFTNADILRKVSSQDATLFQTPTLD